MRTSGNSHKHARFLLSLLLCAIALSSAARGADDTFSWRQFRGQTLRVMFDNHPYALGIIRKIAEFESLTGIRVAYGMYPEQRYFQALDEAFNSESGKPDVYMIGAYQVWSYAPAGRMTPLDAYFGNPSMTRVNYNPGDFFTNIIGSFRWSGQAGSMPGNGPLWALPIGFEYSALTYNREVFARFRLPPPRTMGELLETGLLLNGFEGEGTYGVAARGLGEWNSLHSGYITAFANFGAKDMEVENGRLVSRVNSPEAVAVTDLWVRMLRECGASDWEYFDWYRCLDDIGERKAAILFDSSIVGYFANASGASAQSGKLGMAPPPTANLEGKGKIQSNLWVWGLAINPETENAGAAWLFLQYFTGREFQLDSVLTWKSMNPPRRSVYADPEFQKTLDTMEGFQKTFAQMIDNLSIFFTPNPYFFDISERWAAVIRDIANGMYESTQEGMDTLKVWMDNKLSGVRVENNR